MDTAASLLALLPTDHSVEKREANELIARHEKRANDVASLLAALPAGHGADKRADTAASLLALLPAGHGQK